MLFYILCHTIHYCEVACIIRNQFNDPINTKRDIYLNNQSFPYMSISHRYLGHCFYLPSEFWNLISSDLLQLNFKMVYPVSKKTLIFSLILDVLAWWSRAILSDLQNMLWLFFDITYWKDAFHFDGAFNILSINSSMFSSCSILHLFSHKSHLP